jgi:hypothetical protein
MPGRTLDQMRAFIDRGATVMLDGGRIAASHAELPTEAQLARTSADPDKIAAVKDALRKRRELLDAEIADLDNLPADVAKAQAEAPPAPKAEEKPAADVAPPPETKPEGVFGKRK